MNVEANDQSELLQSGSRRRKWPKRIGAVLLGAIIVALLGFYAYVSDYYHAESTAIELSRELANSGQLRQDDSSIAVGDPHAEIGVVLYPGAKVDPLAYVPLADELAAKDCYCIIAKMPFNLAFFDIDAATEIMERNPQVKTWWVAGHSLGGAMAATFASSHSNELQGVVLLAAYSTSDLSDSGLRVLSIYGSNDGVLNRSALEENAPNLPIDSQMSVLEGGNHAGYGDYGFQEGDGTSSLGASEQWSETAALIGDFIRD